MMAKAGLQALADAYGIERTQQKEFRLLGERFFEQLRDSLTPLLAHAVKLLDLSQSLTSFAAFCAGDPAQHTLIFGQADRPRFAFRIEGGLARVFLDSLLGNSLTPAAEDGSTPAAMTPTEIRMITQVLIDVLVNVAPRILDSLSSAPQLTVSATRNQAGLIPETFPASEPFLAAVGSFTMNGRQGAMAFGLPLAEGLRITSKALATQPPPDIQRDRAKARALLAEAV